MTRTTSVAGRKLIQKFEGLSLTAYPDPGSGGDPWTIGYGATGAGIKRGVKWSQKQAEDRLVADLARFEAGVNAAAPVANQGQFDAMVSFAFNVGLGNFRVSTLLKKHNAKEYAAAGAEFGRWNLAAGKVMAGLTKRRAAEAEMYRSGGA